VRVKLVIVNIAEAIIMIVNTWFFMLRRCIGQV